MTRLIDANALTADILAMRDCPNGFSAMYDKACIIGIIEEQPPVDAIPVEWIKNLIEEDRECAKKAKEGKNEKVFRFHKRLEICISQMLFDWEFENGKHKEFEGELWQD